MQHQELANGRWFTMTLAEQLGNVGSEFSRAANSLKRNDKPRFDSALVRFLELLDLTISDNRWSGFRKKELLRLRETSCEELLNNKPDSKLQKYFDQFVLLARKNK